MKDGGSIAIEQRRTVAEDVYRALKRDILSLRHRPGASLTEQSLATAYGGSRVPVREACRRLQQEGLLTSIPYKGYFVSQISIKEINNCFDLRVVLETHALELAIDRAQAQHLRTLEELAASEYTYDDHSSYIEFLDRNQDFHIRVASLSGNDRLVSTLGDLIAAMQRFFFLGLDLGDYGGEMRGEHEELVALMQEGNKQRAVECLRAQILASRDRILRALRDDGIAIPLE
jgi:DNA-binding GntR family transcriptional regulator